MEVTALMVKELRERTGAGMMDCKKALEENNGDMEKSIDFLREKGLAKAAKKADRLASEGLVDVIINKDHTKATVVEINSETDFVAKTDKFIQLLKNTNAHIQDNDIKDLDCLKQSNINGAKFEDYLNSQIAVIGENLVVRRFVSLSGEAVNGYLHSNSKIAVIIAANLNGANKEKTVGFLKELSMHIAALKPTYINYREFSKDFVEKEFIALKAELEKENEELRRLGKHEHKIPEFASRCQLTKEVMQDAESKLKDELKAEGKPEKIWDKILPGKVDRFIADNSLLDQRLTLLGQFFIMDEKKTVEQVIEEKSKEFGGKIEITSFVRYEVGEGLEKKVDDFAAEVAAQIG